MLWAAAMERHARENRSRRAEVFEATRDAVLAADIAVGRAKSRGIYRLPAYAQPERDPDAAKANLRRLIAEQGGGVRANRGRSADAMREAFLAGVEGPVH